MSIKFIKINIDAVINQNANAITQNEIAMKSERTERLKNAIEQLGNDKSAIVLSGIYTLHRIAEEDESYRENVFNILCAYVRDTTTAKTNDYQVFYKENPSEPIQAILNILCINEEDLEIYRPLESKLIVNFTGTYLRGANLSNANLTSANLTGADLHNVDLRNTNLKNAYLICVNLGTANLIGANLDKADFRGAYSLDYTSYIESFEERIKSRINKETDLSGIHEGYDPENPPFMGEPINGSYSKEEADEIIKKYNDSHS